MFNTEDIKQYSNMNNSVSFDSNTYDSMDNKINRATLEQKLAIVLFFNKHKAEMPRFKLVNMLNKKISISISSLSSWLKKEDSLKEKYVRISNTPIDSFDFNQIIHDILNIEDNQLSADNANLSDRHNSISLNHINLSKKDNLRSKYIKINKMMDDLVIERKKNQLPITESILKSYWVKFFPLCDIKDPKRSKGPSNGWLDNFKNKHELKNYGSGDYNFTFENVKSNENKVSKKNNKNIKNKKDIKSPLTNTISSEKILQNSPSSKLMYDHEDSTISHQSGLYITKPTANKYSDINTRNNNSIYDEKMNLKPQSMAMSISERNNLGDQSVPLTATASLNAGPQEVTVNIRNNINNMQSRIMASQTDLLNALKPPQQESTDSFFKKFGSGIFNFNNASSKDLENVNAFFQQQKQNQSTFNNENIKKNDSTSILSWFKNTAFQPQQKPPSSGMSFLNLSQYNKREEIPSSGVDSENLSNREHTLYSEIDISNKNHDNKQTFLRNQGIKSDPILNKRENKRLSKILSGETFNDNLKNKEKKDYMSDDSDDSDGGLEINVPKNFINEEVDVLLNVHIFNYLNKNQSKHRKSLEKFNEFMDVFQSEK